MDEATLKQAMQAQLEGSGDLYAALNHLRDWTNAHCPDFELYLEDVWNEHKAGETWFEYILRSRKTLDETDPIGYDVYLNHQDANAVWHLDDYQYTVRLLDDVQPLIDFMKANGGLQNIKPIHE